ncbi:dipeptidase PepE [Thalassomonas sp. RHCl1]|uniref:dipeptidase PepE n=1 Tax=Thalassomonas sp. RHCl1 TaxID=2995320 RepID=UPI00248B3FC9|nr:dipeptidase PepE [Thalassomonas sp. RHCl1]
MTNAHLLLLSSSRAKQTDYLSHAKEMIKEHLGDIKELLFIPYAGITINYDEYTEMVQTALADLDIKVTGIHSHDNAADAVRSAQAIAVGGGNTFHLLHQLYQHELLAVIREKVNSGMPYIGWSAGSNVAGLSIRTTNDMPIIEPPSFNALNLVNFQLNPHFTDYNPPGHNGETRSQRLAEFMVVDKETPIVAIVEGTALKFSQGKLSLIGPEPGFIFQGGEKSDITPDTDLTHLLG